MKSFARLAISFFVLSLIVLSVAYLFGPATFREAFRSHESPVGQLNDDSTVKTPGQPAESK